MRLKFALLCAFVVCGLTAAKAEPPGATAPAAPTYRLEFLPLPAGATGILLSINNLGQVSGGYNLGPRDYKGGAALWTGGHFKALGSAAGPVAFGAAVNDRGDVAGYTKPPGFSSQAVVWTADGQITQLDSSGGAASAYANNGRGDTVGARWRSPDGAGDPHATLWSGGAGKPIDLKTPSGTFSEAFGINGTGDIVGYGGPPDRRRALLWSGSKVTTLKTLSGADWSQAVAINDKDYIVGASGAGKTLRATAWSGGSVTELRTLKDYRNSDALAVNEQGDAVGTSFSDGRASSATLWRAGAVIDLNDAVVGSKVHLLSAISINRQGDIVVLYATGNSNAVAGYGVLHPTGQVAALSANRALQASSFAAIRVAASTPRAAPQGACREGPSGAASLNPRLALASCSAPSPTAHR